MTRFLLPLALLAVCTPLRAGPNAVMDAAQKRIAAFHAGEKPSGAFVRVVYFHAADREPLPKYAARLDRSLTDISMFFRDGMTQRFGVKTAGLPFERKDGKLVVHPVRGKQPAAHYDYKSGDETWREVRAALEGTIDPDREHVLVVYGLCEREADGKYVFHAPYYGATWSNQVHGLCHAADCELLDPPLLAAKDKPMVFKEHYYDRMAVTVAKFNTMYLGGLAHELGHGLGFPHDNGGPVEAPAGVALMGGGNLHYRETVWGGRRPAYLSLATALRFAAHPLVTQSDKARWEPADAAVEDLTATADKGTLRITGRVRASVPTCAVIASAWPTTAKTDHVAVTFCAAVDDDGKFKIELTNLAAPAWNVNLGTLLVNGAEVRNRAALRCDAKGNPDAAAFQADWTVNAAEQAVMRDPARAEKLLTDDAIAAAPTEDARRQMRLLRAALGPAAEPLDLTTATIDRVFLSDAKWTKAEVGWGKVARNRYWFNQGLWEGVLLKLDGRVYDKGLYAHAKSEFDFPLGGGWKAFTATVGLRDGATDQGSAVFRVVGDGKELFRSKVLRPGQTESVQVSVAGVQKLELHADGGEGHTNNSWAVWADPLVQR